MSFRTERDKANALIASHIGECVYVDGHAVSGIAREDATDGALSIPIQGEALQVDILTTDAQRIGARRGMSVEWFDASGMPRQGKVRNIVYLRSGWASIEIES